jgi:hypothetical protein
LNDKVDDLLAELIANARVFWTRAIDGRLNDGSHAHLRMKAQLRRACFKTSEELEFLVSHQAPCDDARYLLFAGSDASVPICVCLEDIFLEEISREKMTTV